MLKSMFLGLLALSLATLAQAGSPEQGSAQSEPPGATRSVPEALADMVSTVREELKPGGRYEWVDKEDRRDLEYQLQTMERIVSGIDSIDELNDRLRIRLMNAQEKANAILTGDRYGRLVCENYKPVGSHHQEKVCVSVAQRDRIKENSRAYINEAQSYRALPGNGPRAPGGSE